jgi:hypothetical protein
VVHVEYDEGGTVFVTMGGDSSVMVQKCLVDYGRGGGEVWGNKEYVNEGMVGEDRLLMNNCYNGLEDHKY